MGSVSYAMGGADPAQEVTHAMDCSILCEWFPLTLICDSSKDPIAVVTAIREYLVKNYPQHEIVDFKGTTRNPDGTYTLGAIQPFSTDKVKFHLIPEGS